MKHIVKILTLVIAITALWVGLLQTSIIPRSHTWLVGIHVIMCLVFILNYLFGFWYKIVLGRKGFSVSKTRACNMPQWGLQVVHVDSLLLATGLNLSLTRKVLWFFPAETKPFDDSLVFFFIELYNPYNADNAMFLSSMQLPIYFVVSLGCYGLLMVGVGLMNFPTCPQEALLLQKVFVYFFCSLEVALLYNWFNDLCFYGYYGIWMFLDVCTSGIYSCAIVCMH